MWHSFCPKINLILIFRNLLVELRVFLGCLATNIFQILNSNNYQVGGEYLIYYLEWGLKNPSGFIFLSVIPEKVDHTSAHRWSSKHGYESYPFHIRLSSSQHRGPVILFSPVFCLVEYE